MIWRTYEQSGPSSQSILFAISPLACLPLFSFGFIHCSANKTNQQLIAPCRDMTGKQIHLISVYLKCQLVYSLSLDENTHKQVHVYVYILSGRAIYCITQSKNMKFGDITFKNSYLSFTHTLVMQISEISQFLTFSNDLSSDADKLHRSCLDISHLDLKFSRIEITLDNYSRTF